jgi:secondary thiamine-phosphate synthase enzyme
MRCPEMYHTTISVRTHGEGEIVNLSPRVEQAVAESGIQEGLVSVFVTGSTAAVTTIEYEPGVLADLRRALSVIAPADISYAHDAAWGDGNGRSHVRAAIVGPSLTVPVVGGRLACGTWQQIVLLELDVRSSRERTVHVTVLG